MRDGFIKVAAGTPKIRVADCHYNAEQIFTMMRDADQKGVRVLVLPELCITGVTCGDLFYQDVLIRGAEEALGTVLEATKNLDMLTVVGLPVRCTWDGKLYNCAALIRKGEILGLVPKVNLPAGSELQQSRWFASGLDTDFSVKLCGQETALSDKGLFFCRNMPDLVIGVEVGEDLWAVEPPSTALAQGGAALILNPAASSDYVGRAEYRRAMVTGQSSRLVCGYVSAGAGEGESTTDLVFGGHNMIAENGEMLAQQRFSSVIEPHRCSDFHKLLCFFLQQRDNAGSATFRLPFSLSVLADYIATDRSAMVRELKKMREEGILSGSGRDITLCTDLL